MAAITVGFAEFESRLERVRRRLNRLALLDAACVAGAALLIAATAAIAAESTLSTPLSSLVRRVAAGAAVLVAAAAAWHLRGRWLDLPGAARHVDRHAGMEARIATMLAHPTVQGASPTRSILLWQIFDRAALWEAERIAPRGARRPAMVLLVALASFLAARALAPAPLDAPDPATGPAASRAAAPPEVVAVAAGGPTGAEAGDRRGGDGGADRTDGAGSAGAHGAGDREPAPGGESETQGSAGGGNPGAAGGSDPAVPAPDGGAEQTAGVSGGRVPPDMPDSLSGELEPIPPPQGNEARPRLPQSAAPPTRPADQTTAGESPVPDPQRAPLADGGPKAGADHSKKGGPAGARGVLGDENNAARLATAEKTEPMVIQLKAFAANPVEQLVPQGKERADDATAGTATEESAPAPIADLQVEDSLLQRSIVTRAHQDLIRDLFTPGRQ